LLIVALVGVAALAVLAFLAGFVIVGSESSIAATVVTSEAGEVPGTGDSLVLVVRGESELAELGEERLETRLDAEGYGVAVAQGLSGYEGPVLVVDVPDRGVQQGVLSHRANVTVESYFASDWNETGFARYEQSGIVELRADGEGTAVAAGEYNLVDRSRGLSSRYRQQVADQLVEAIVDGFRGEIPR